MTPTRAITAAALILMAISLFVPSLATGQIPGVSREQMWPAPTAEDWKKPCLIKWQRTWEDALTVSREQGKAILVCVNMDGEIASEHYAGIRYRQPDITKLYEPYVCVIASVYRHTPRDYDENGKRVPCPRFGGVTCGEHITIEPTLFEKFMDGQRVAPRHIMVELDGKETYDVFYAFDTDSVFKAINDGIENRPKGLLKNIVRGDRSIMERVASKDSDDRRAVEKAYLEGDKQLKRALLEAAKAEGKDVPVELLRLAINGFDTELSKAALSALAQANSGKAVELIADSMRVPMGDKERTDLIDALTRLGKKSDRARTLAVVHRGLNGGETAVDVGGWSSAIQGTGASYAAAPSPNAVASTISKHDATDGSEDPNTHLELAEAYLQRAMASEGPSSSFATALLSDARDAATRAKKLNATGWRVNAILAVTNYYLDDAAAALTHAEAAVKGMPEDPTSWNSMIVLGLFVDARRSAIEKAVRARQDWPGEWLTDVHATYSILADHPHGDDTQITAHYDFLVWLGGTGKAEAALDNGMRRFPDSWRLHNRLRGRILKDKGAAHLEKVYGQMLASKPTGENAPRNLEWFAGYATMIAAESRRQAGEHQEGRAAYDRAIALFERSIAVNESLKGTADHYIAVAMGGQARIAFEAGDDARCLADVLASFGRKEEAANHLDGLNISAVDTAKMLRARLATNSATDSDAAAMAARLADAMSKLDPKLLELPAYENAGPRRAPSRRDPRSLLRFDKNGDGKVHGQELPDILRKRLLDRYDTNRSGAIESSELVPSGGGK